MKTRLNIADKNGFIFFDGKLQAYEFDNAVVNFESGMVEYRCKLGGKDTVLCLFDCPKVYGNEEAFRADSGYCGREVNFAGAVNSSFGTSYRDANNDNIDTVKVWCISNNEPVLVTAPLSLYRFNKNCRAKYIGDEQYYETKNVALLYCDLIKVDADGTETIKMSPSKLVSLDDKQRKVLNEIISAFKKAKELDMKFVLNYDGDDINVYSAKNIEKIEYDCVGYQSEGTTDITLLLEEIDLPIVSLNLCDCGVFVTWK